MLFAFDLDRTVVTEDYQLPDRIADAVHELRRIGHMVTVLTGRPFRSAAPFLEKLGVDAYFSVNHGAMVYGADGQSLRRTRLAAADVRALIHPFRSDPLVEYSCIDGDHLYVKDPSDQRWRWAHTETRSVVRFELETEVDADKVVFAAAGANLVVAEHAAQLLPHTERYLWGDGFLEVIAQGGDKGSGLALLAAELGVPREQVVAFGDGLNDVSMLRWAGRSVAVGPEAHEDALAAADEHIAPPEEGGVVDWLERNVLGVLAP